MRKSLLTLAVATTLAACSGAPEPVHSGSPYSVDIKRDGVDVFGTAGSALTDQQLREAVAARTICNDAKEVRNIEITRGSGAVTFTGVCS